MASHSKRVIYPTWIPRSGLLNEGEWVWIVNSSISLFPTRESCSGRPWVLHVHVHIHGSVLITMEVIILIVHLLITYLNHSVHITNVGYCDYLNLYPFDYVPFIRYQFITYKHVFCSKARWASATHWFNRERTGIWKWRSTSGWFTTGTRNKSGENQHRYYYVTTL